MLLSTYLWGSALQNQRNQQLSLTAENSDSSSDKRAQAQRLAIAQLASDPDYASTDIARVSRGLSKILSEVIQVERASIWLFSQTEEFFDCIALFDHGVAQDAEGMQLEVRVFPRYFAALRNDSRIYASDAVADPRTSEFAEIYLKPLNISAMLDAGIVVDGQLVGVICLEHRHGVRQWLPDEEAFASLIATLVAQKLVNTEKLKALDNLALTKKRLEHILDAASQISVIATNADGIITLFNKGAENLLGYSASEMLYKQTPAIIHLESEVIAHGRELSAELGEKIEGFEVFVAKARRGGFEEREWTYVRKDGKHVPILLTVTAIRNDADEIVGLLGVAADMTQRHRHQLELELHNRDLAIANEQAKLLIQEADQANKAKSEFLASMSHEIRTPMNGVLGMLHLIGREPLLPSQQHYLNLASSSARSLLSIINDILDFSKIDAKQLKLELLEFDLILLLSDIGKSMAIRAQENGVSLVLDLADIKSEKVRGDPHRLRQVITNLLGNAVKFTEQGEVLLRAALSEKSGCQWLSVSVIDTGIGVPEEKISSLFTAFSQADSSNTRRFGGTGLGLVISKQLVELMGGSIGVKSSAGEGSHFYFSLPLEGVLGQSATLENETSSSVLLIDTAPSSRVVVLAELMLLGARVYMADSLSEASEKYPDVEFSLLLIDDEFYEEVRRLPDRKDTSIYILTNIAHHGDLPANCAGYIHRPVARNDLRKALGVEFSKLSTQFSAPSLCHLEAKVERDARILLVEDNVINQQVAMGLLADLGLTITVAKDGLEALTLFENAKVPFELILMDCQMPRMDGFEATKRIRALGANTTPIIAMTANAMSGDREHCIASGMNDYIAKPIEPNILADRVFFWLSSVSKDVRHVVPTRQSMNPEKNSKVAQVRDNDIVTIGNDKDSLQVWNINSALARVRGKPERLKMLISLFEQDMPARIEAIQSEFERKNFQEVAQLAHQIKGVAGNLSGESLAKVAGRLQLECSERDPDVNALKKSVTAVVFGFNELLVEFQGYLKAAEVDGKNKKGLH